jgi:hypothetical protein
MSLDREKHRQECRRDYTKHRERRRETGNNYYRKLKLALFELLGDRCAECGFDNAKALQIDHLAGGGTEHSRNVAKGTLYYKSILNDPEVLTKFQVLCANCNWIKRVDNKECIKEGGSGAYSIYNEVPLK